jgi:hypothetical protein
MAFSLDSTKGSPKKKSSTKQRGKEIVRTLSMKLMHSLAASERYK